MVIMSEEARLLSNQEYKRLEQLESRQVRLYTAYIKLLRALNLYPLPEDISIGKLMPVLTKVMLKASIGGEGISKEFEFLGNIQDIFKDIETEQKHRAV